MEYLILILRILVHSELLHVRIIVHFWSLGILNSLHVLHPLLLPKHLLVEISKRILSRNSYVKLINLRSSIVVLWFNYDLLGLVLILILILEILLWLENLTRTLFYFLMSSYNRWLKVFHWILI